MNSQIILSLLNPLVTWFIAALLLALWIYQRPKRHILLFALGFFLGGLAFAIRDFGMREEILGEVPGRAIANLLFLGTTLAICLAVHVYYRLRIPVVAFLLVSAVGAVSFSWALFAVNDIVMRVLSVHLTLLALVVITFARVLPLRQRAPVDLAILFGGVAGIINLLLPLLFLARANDTTYWTMTLVTSVLLEVILSLIFLVVVASEILQALRSEARTDVLSGLLNRRGFEEDVTGLLVAGQERAPALILMDIDHFKSVNDRYGHAVGDEVIRTCGMLLNSVAGSDIRVGRVGGEEFAVCLADGGAAVARDLAEMLCCRLATTTVSMRVPTLRTTGSFGVAPARDGEDLTSLLARADEALYAAKRSGRNRVCTVGFASTRGGDPAVVPRRAFRDRPVDREGGDLS